MHKHKLKVFLGLVNYGTQAGLLSMEFRKRGITSLSVSNNDPYKRQIDVILLSGNNWITRNVSRICNLIRKIIWFFRFNTFHFFYGTTLIIKQRDLPFYHFFGKKIVMHYLGYDVQLFQTSIKKYDTTNVSSYKSIEEAVKEDKIKTLRLKNESKYADIQIVGGPYLSEFVEKSIVVPLGIDLSGIPFYPLKLDNNIIKVLHAPTHRGNKGTQYIINAVEKLKLDGFNIDFSIAENLNHDEVLSELRECHIFIDQLLVGWYGTAAVEAMALGRPTLCFIREDYFKYINYSEKIPIINANPGTIYSVLKKIIRNSEELPKIGLQSRRFVEEVHNLSSIADNLIEIYEKL